VVESLAANDPGLVGRFSAMILRVFVCRRPLSFVDGPK
jgi:hypothetical protein